MKKLFSIILVLTMLASLIGCSGQTSGEITTEDVAAEQTPAREETEPEVAQTEPEATEADETTAEETVALKTPEEAAAEELAETLESKIKLTFDEKGEFKILVLADLHLKTGGMPEIMENNIKTLVDREEPDLVILTGDNTSDKSIRTDKAMKTVLGEAMDYIEEKKIPWMHVYGNHDSEGTYSREQQQKVYESFEYCISKAGDEELTGVGNYVIPLYSSDGKDIKFAIWGLDSGAYMSDEDKKNLFPEASTFEGYTEVKYDYIHQDQIEWYVSTSKKLQQMNGGEVLPGLMAFHIPLQESYTAWVNRGSLANSGEKRDVVASSALNSGLFSVLSARGDIKAVINGHDHKNDYMVDYNGIKLCYCSTVSVNTYYAEDMHGGRVLVIKENDLSNIETYMSYVAERVEPEAAEPYESGKTYDFEGEAPEFTVTSYPYATVPEAYVAEIKTDIVEGVGVNGSKALAVTRTAYHDAKKGQNIEIRWDLDRPGTIGSNKYMMVWLDLATNGIEFRKASIGLIKNGVNTSYFTTDNMDTPTEFYYKADGSDTWITLKTGKDGCFGAGDGSPVKEYKGWFAFPIENMLHSSTGEKIKEDDVITGLFFYMSLYDQSMIGKYTYVDNFMLVENYK